MSPFKYYAHLHAQSHYRSDALPEEDQETQQALMERVLEILLAVENLTDNERARVQDGLTFIRSDITRMSPQDRRTRYASLSIQGWRHTLTISRLPGVMNPPLDLESLSDVSTLIDIRYNHQSEEEAKSVRVAWAHTGRNQEGEDGSNDGNADQDSGQVHLHTSRPSATTPQDSERRQLAKKINEIIKASAEVPVGGSTGSNRRARWKTDKVSAGSTLPENQEEVATGNSANAQLAARNVAQAVSFSSSRT